ncbi:MAG: hypothetical protein JWN44_5025 [Myxococcales bacterium]|nr:hypothetical protein [Myxococcales bacterium]
MLSSLARLGVPLGLALAAGGCLGSFDNSSTAGPDMAAASSDLASDPATGGKAPAYFAPDIQHDLDTLGCTASACHGGSASPLITAMPAAAADWMSNYTNIRVDCTTLDCLSGGAASLLLTKPLQGSVSHGGTKPFASPADPTYQRWQAWLDAGAPYSASGLPAPADMASTPSGTDMKSSELVTLTFTTSASPSAGASPYDPKNVVAVWIEGPGGTFVKTVGRWANTRRGKLVGWVTKAGNADVDAVSGATNAAYGTLTAKWDLTSRQSPAPPLSAPADGIYTIRMELADSNATQAAQNNQGTFTFNRNGTASTQTNLSNGGFSNVSVVYSGR